MHLVCLAFGILFRQEIPSSSEVRCFPVFSSFLTSQSHRTFSSDNACTFTTNPMHIPPERLESTKQALHNLVDERTSAPWADYSEEDLNTDEQDRNDIERIKTVADALHWLLHQGARTTLVEWTSCLDPLDGFRVEGKEYPDEADEEAFRAYLRATYSLKVP
jgi:hypothetical protein